MFSRGYFLQSNNIKTIVSGFVREYAFKSDLKIKWVRPEKIPCYKPEKSGDLTANKPIDKSSLILEFRESKELKSASNDVKKLFTLEFAPRWMTTQVAVKDNVDLVKRHPLDYGSIESRIAKWTGCIRSMQELMERFPRNKGVKIRLKELIDKRRKYLKYLRKWDYKRFEWILDRLDLFYKPVPNDGQKVTRKDSLRKLTDLHCENLRQERLEEYRKFLEEQQPAFLEEKINMLEMIRKEQQEYNAPITILQEEIDETRNKLKDVLERRQLQEQATQSNK